LLGKQNNLLVVIDIEADPLARSRHIFLLHVDLRMDLETLPFVSGKHNKACQKFLVSNQRLTDEHGNIVTMLVR
jgi:hypothetical protein